MKRFLVFGGIGLAAAIGATASFVYLRAQGSAGPRSESPHAAAHAAHQTAQPPMTAQQMQQLIMQQRAQMALQAQGTAMHQLKQQREFEQKSRLAQAKVDLAELQRRLTTAPFKNKLETAQLKIQEVLLKKEITELEAKATDSRQTSLN